MADLVHLNFAVNLGILVELAEPDTTAPRRLPSLLERTIRLILIFLFMMGVRVADDNGGLLIQTASGFLELDFTLRLVTLLWDSFYTLDILRRVAIIDRLVRLYLIKLMQLSNGFAVIFAFSEVWDRS